MIMPSVRTFMLGVVTGWSVCTIRLAFDARGTNVGLAAFVADERSRRSLTRGGVGNDPPPPAPRLRTFTEILMESGSDKFSRHHFERYYTAWLEPHRDKAGLKLLEIGAEAGRSLALWDRYFAEPALVMGLAYKAGTDQLPDRLSGMLHNVTVIFGDQSKVETMQALADAGPFDIIIDDGSHVPQHVMFSLYSLWKTSVKPGGMYVIEDLETSYRRNQSTIYNYTLESTGIGAKPEHSVVAKLEQIQQVLARHQIGAQALKGILPGDEDICSVEWGMNLVVLRKCSKSFKKPDYVRKRHHEKSEMDAWIREARRTNPVGYLDTGRLDRSQSP
jgi:hypothetical protein